MGGARAGGARLGSRRGGTVEPNIHVVRGDVRDGRHQVAKRGLPRVRAEEGRLAHGRRIEQLDVALARACRLRFDNALDDIGLRSGAIRLVDGPRTTAAAAGRTRSQPRSVQRSPSSTRVGPSLQTRPATRRAPPGTTPSSTAARVECSASSTRAFFSFISTSVAAPTRITATPPASLATRSCSFSLS